MKHIGRPTQITEILKAIDAEYPAAMGADLEVCIANLEAKRRERPAPSAEILKTIDADHPLDMGTVLETYIADLEARQQLLPPQKGPASRDPEWLYVHAAKREQQRRAWALRKQNNYQ